MQIGAGRPGSWSLLWDVFEGVILSFGLRFPHMYNRGIGTRCKLGFFYLQSMGIPKLCLRFLQISRNRGSHSWGHLWLRASAPDLPRWGFRKASQWFCPLVKNRTTAWENHCGLSELWQHELGFFLMYWNYLPKWTGKKENLSPWPRFKTILLREDERTRKRPSSQHHIQKQRWPATMSHSRGFGNWFP